MKKVILAAFMLLAVGSATMAQTAEKRETASSGQTTKKPHAKKHHHKAHNTKTQAGTAKK
jgi:hypothetical protein